MSIAAKLPKVMLELPDLSSDSLNPHYRTKYVSLNAMVSAIRPVLVKHDIALLQPVEGDRVVTRLVDAEDGDSIESWLPLPPEIVDPQKIGGIITYYRRYTLAALLAIAVDVDDDGNSVGGDRSRQSSPVRTAPRQAKGEISREEWLARQQQT